MKSYLSSHSLPSQPLPLEKALGGLILALCVSAHFFALGSKADPDLLAYDETQNWQVPIEFVQPNASEVLFASEVTWQTTSVRTLGLADTLTVTSPTASPVIGTPLQAISSRFESSLTALNFGY